MSFEPNRNRGISICGSGIETMCLPCRPISSPWVRYLRNAFLTWPRTISLKRLTSRSMRWSTIVRSAKNDDATPPRHRGHGEKKEECPPIEEAPVAREALYANATTVAHFLFETPCYPCLGGLFLF